MAGLANHYRLQREVQLELPSHTSLPDKLNYFYARVKENNTETCMRVPAVPEDCVITLSYKQINVHKAAGPDRLPGRVQ